MEQSFVNPYIPKFKIYLLINFAKDSDKTGNPIFIKITYIILFE